MNETPLEFQVSRRLSNLARVSLEIFEDLSSDYSDTQTKLLESIDNFGLSQEQRKLLESIICQGCLFTPNKIQNIRKRILDKQGEYSRELAEEFKKYTIKL